MNIQQIALLIDDLAFGNAKTVSIVNNKAFESYEQAELYRKMYDPANYDGGDDWEIKTFKVHTNVSGVSENLHNAHIKTKIDYLTNLAMNYNG